MKPLEHPKAFKVLFWCNVAILLGHMVLETLYKDINWSQVGGPPRSSGSMAYMWLEALVSMMMGSSVFEMYYPSMGKMLKSKEASWCGILICVQLLVWFVYV